MPALTCNGLELFYRERGEGPPVLFIAGMGGDHRAFAAQATALQDAYRCISYDHRDVGQSDPAQGPYTIGELAEDAAGLLAALGIPAAHIVGFSMGGATAQELALRYPERVRSLALIATYTSSDPRGDERMRSWALLHRQLPPLELLQATWPWVYTVEDYRQPGFMEGSRERVMSNPSPPSPDAYSRQVEAVLSHHTEGRLGRITMPTLLVFGEEDLLTPFRFARTLMEEIPQAQLVTIPGAGHGLLWTHGEILTALLRGWLAENGSRAGSD